MAEKQIEQGILNQYMKAQTGEDDIFLQMARFLQLTKNRMAMSQYCNSIFDALDPSQTRTIHRFRTLIDADQIETRE